MKFHTFHIKEALRADWFVFANLAIFISFSIAYSMLDAKTHFNGVDGRMSHSTVAYFAAVTQTSTGYGDISPKSDVARRFVTAHVMLTWMLLAALSGAFITWRG